MRKTLVFLLLLCTKLTFAQLNDSFSDGDFTNNPVWVGNTSNFTVNPNGQLQSNGPNLANQSIYLSTSNSRAKNAIWEFSIQLNFDPTASNFPRVYLVSNQADLSAALQGYFFQVGETGAMDGFHLYKQNGTSTTQIITGAAKTRSNTNLISARIKVTRDDDGKWELYADVAGGTNYALEGSVMDNSYTVTTHFGVNCRYGTASRYNQFIFDDFKITELIPDATPPKITTIKSLNTKTIEVTFDEPLGTTSAQAIANYSLSKGVGNPVAAVMGSTANVVNLTFANDLTSGEYTLTVNNVADTKGNAIIAPVTKNFIYVMPYVAEKGDVVINEIMADPTPIIGLPEKEWIELFNTTDKYIIITGWKYKDGTTAETTLGADTLAPKEYRILCANADVATFKTYGKTLGIAPWPSLNNDTDDLSLKDANGNLIFNVQYSDAWYKDSVKKNGGYTLELINPTGTCNGAFNWMASNNAIGGTPGVQNSAYNLQHTDNVAPKLLATTILSPTEVKLDFDKSIATAQLTDLNNYSINNAIGKPNSVVINSFENQSVTLTFTEAIKPNVESLLTVSNISNCAGVPLDPSTSTALILITEPVKSGDLLISEILFNPKNNGFDFVEIYNPTHKILDLKGLSIANPLAANTTKRVLSTTSVYIRPKTYWVLTANTDNIQQNYDVKNQGQLVQVTNMPSFNNDKGRVVLWNAETAIDSLDYTENMHHALLKEVKGVSLERVSFTKSANEAGNLQSAAASVGFATPTYINSQTEDLGARNSVVVANKTFSPDNDGFEDLLQIDYHFKENGNLAAVNVYTDRGVLVRRLAKNMTLSTQGVINWDGLSDGGQLCKVGLYVIKIDTFNVNGNADHFKQTCVLASKLN